MFGKKPKDVYFEIRCAMCGKLLSKTLVQGSQPIGFIEQFCRNCKIKMTNEKK